MHSQLLRALAVFIDKYLDVHTAVRSGVSASCPLFQPRAHTW